MHAPREPDPSLFAEPPEEPSPGAGKAATRPPEDAASRRNTRYGLWLFAGYVLIYAGFILLATFLPGLMRRTPLGGVNVAILYGIGLIVGALVLALVYMVLCRDTAQREGVRA